MRKQAVTRIRLITGIVLLICLILVGRLYHIQVLQAEHYAQRAENQYVHTVQDLYNRGSIFFTTKDGELVSAATVQRGYLLAMDPSRVVNAQEAYDQLSTILSIDHDTFIQKAQQADSRYQVIQQQVTAEEAGAIEALSIPGVSLYRNQWRYYPGENLSSRTIGFVGYSADSGDDLSGKYGLERYYDDVLVRENDVLSVNFFAEIFSNLGSVIFDTTKKRTGDVVTTLEPTVSRILDQQLQKTQDTYGSTLTGGIIINPKTGAIYAMNAVPTVNLNDRSGAGITEFRNPLVEDVYEFGSIIKALTMAAGLDANAVSPHTTYYDSGRLELDTFTIHNYDGKGRGTVDMQEVLNQSLNTGVAFVVQQMGKDAFRQYFKSLKLGSETGIDLPNETYGLISNLDSPRDVEYATASFGQGIAMTPVATVRALSALANGGHLIFPHLVSEVHYQEGTVKEVPYPEGDRVFEEKTSETISRMLVTVVDDALAGGTEKLENYSVAAKTGTAQIADETHGGYYEDQYLHSFFGYFPAYDPEYLVFLYTVEPQGVRYASETLTEPFMELTKFLINYYNVPPDRQASPVS